MLYILVYMDKLIGRYNDKYPTKHHNADLETAFIYTDSSSSDNWGADFQGHSVEISKNYNTQLVSGTLPGGENKWIYDTYGSHGKRLLLIAMKNEDITFTVGERPAKSICEYMNKKMEEEGKSDKYEWVYVTAEELQNRDTDIDTLKIGPKKQGIKEFRCSRADADGTIWFKKMSCFCPEMQEGKFKKDCKHSAQTGIWLKVYDIISKSEAKKNKRVIEIYEYDETNPVFVQLFGPKNMNKINKTEIIKNCKKYNVKYRTSDRKCEIIGALIQWAVPRMIPPQYRHCIFWTYCIGLEYAKKMKIIQFLKGELQSGSYDTEDIVMMSIKKDDDTTIKKVFRMDFISRRYKILIFTNRKRQRLNNM